MSTAFGSLTLLLALLIATAHVLGWAFARFRQPRVVGEILAGIALGPVLLGRFVPQVTAAASGENAAVISFLYNFGLLLLMFASGAQTRGLFHREDRREVAWLALVGTGLPFALALAVAPLAPLHTMMGSAARRPPLILVIGIAVAVTSIPVISKILHDLGILHTRFARLILGVAVFEDVVLWAVLAVATALAHSGSVPQDRIALHVLAAFVYFGFGLLVAPRLLARLTRARWNVLARANPVAYVVTVLLAYSAVAAALDVSLVFAAFLAGMAVIKEPELADAVQSIGRVSFAVFIPVYFALVGYQLDLTHTFSLTLLAVFLTLACVVKLLSAGAGARLAGFPWRDAVNLSVALNARGGPGIVLASVAYEAGIINAQFFTTLVLVAVLTSQAAGTWLEHTLRSGKPLLIGVCEPLPAPAPAVGADEPPRAAA